MTGAGNPAAGLLLLEILQDKSIFNEYNLEIRLHDDRKDMANALKSLLWDIEGYECPDISKRNVYIVEDLYNAIKGCQFLIIMTEVKRYHVLFYLFFHLLIFI